MGVPPRLVCNNFWQTLARHHLDLPHDTAHLYSPRDGPFLPEDVVPDDVVFVKTDLLDFFVAHALPRVRCRFVLVTGHSDLTPSPGAADAVLRDPRVVRWLAQNVVVDDDGHAPAHHPKLTHIPIGLSEPDRPFGNQGVVEECMARVAAVADLRDPRVFFPAAGPTHPLREALAHVHHPNLARCSDRLSFRDYLARLGAHAYALCPRGNGPDVHRVHEAILMRTVPIYVSDVVPALFARLPVVVVRSVEALRRVLDSPPLAPDQVDWDAAQRYLVTDRVREVYGLHAGRDLGAGRAKGQDYSCSKSSMASNKGSSSGIAGRGGESLSSMASNT